MDADLEGGLRFAGLGVGELLVEHDEWLVRPLLFPQVDASAPEELATDTELLNRSERDVEPGNLGPERERTIHVPDPNGDVRHVLDRHGGSL